MKMLYNNIKKMMVAAAVAVMAVAPFAMASGQDAQSQPQAPKTLFKYPVAPDTISTLEGRTNYIVSKFWDNYNLSKPIQDSIGFDGAFRDYITFFKYAHRNIVFSSIKNFMNKAQSNTPNSIMIMEIAEKALYAPGAEYWSDEAYLPFAKSFVESKKVKSIYKERYKSQIKKIEHSLQGAVASDFSFTKPDKSKMKLSEITDKWILIFFNDPDCDDCSIARLRLGTDVTINKQIDEGRLVVLSIYPGSYSKEWANQAGSYPDKWLTGASEEVEDNYDIRFSPSFYLLDKDHKIVSKNMNLDEVKNMFTE